MPPLTHVTESILPLGLLLLIHQSNTSDKNKISEAETLAPLSLRPFIVCGQDKKRIFNIIWVIVGYKFDKWLKRFWYFLCLEVQLECWILCSLGCVCVSTKNMKKRIENIARLPTISNCFHFLAFLLQCKKPSTIYGLIWNIDVN